MDARGYHLAREIACLEAALAQERTLLGGAPDPAGRQARRLNLAAAHEALGVLYRRLHALGADGDPPLETVQWIGGALAPARWERGRG